MSAEKEARDAEFTAFMQASAPVLLRTATGQTHRAEPPRRRGRIDRPVAVAVALGGSRFVGQETAAPLRPATNNTTNASAAEVVGTVTIPDHRGTYAVEIDGSRVTYYSVDPW